jgi:hypothetical protein
MVMGSLGKSKRQGVALTAPDMRLFNILVAEGTKSRYSYSSPQAQENRFDPSLQDHIRTGIIPLNIGHRTGAAKIWCPMIRWRCVSNQPTFLTLASSEIIPKEKAAFFAGWGLHLIPDGQW